MNDTISISQLKTTPKKAIDLAADYPVAIQNRNQTQAYLIGSELYGKIMDQLEDVADRRIINQTDFSKGKSLEQIETELGL